MFMKRALPIVAGAVLGLGVVTSTAQAQFTSDEIVREVVAPIENIPDGIEGALMYEVKRNRTDFTIAVEGLPAGAYAVYVGGEFRGFLSSFRTQGFDTFAELVFSTRQRGDRLLLNFEPRDQLVEIRSLIDANRLYASGRLPFSVPVSENEPVEYEKVKIREDFASLDGSFASGRIDIRANKRKAQAKFKVKGLVPGVYQLRADGMVVGSIVSVGRGKGEIKFSTQPRGSQRPLTFDPTGVMYELVRVDLSNPQTGDNEELPSLVGQIGSAQDPEGDLMPVGMAENIPTSSGFDQDGTAKVTFESGPDLAQLRVELENVPAGVYQIGVQTRDGDYDFIGTVRVDPVDDTPADNMGDPDMMEDPMLPQGVGPDNAGEATRGSRLITTSAFTDQGEEVDENGNRVLRLFFDDQGAPLVIVDGAMRVYFKGTFPDTGFPVDEDLFEFIFP
ncbi:MAG: hypothetical protein Tsb0013_05970 [Phycisphaerales bacterium]